MSELFLKIVNISISAGWFILAVFIIRIIFRKIPKYFSVIIWGIVGMRLLLPISIKSVFSLIPSSVTIKPDIMTEPIPTVTTGIKILNNTLNPVIGHYFSPTPEYSVNPLQILIPVLSFVWISGICAFLFYLIFSCLHLRKKLGTSVRLNDNIFKGENITFPFIFGLIKPKIYIPNSIDEKNFNYVISHERAHISRKDYIWKAIGFILLIVHWFNPLMWAAYIMLYRDIELACDEKIISQMCNEEKANYSQALLNCSTSNYSITSCPLAFNEVGVKKRVKNVMNYKKPAFHLIIISAFLCLALATCFLTDPKDTQNEISWPVLSDSISQFNINFGKN